MQLFSAILRTSDVPAILRTPSPQPPARACSDLRQLYVRPSLRRTGREIRNFVAWRAVSADGPRMAYVLDLPDTPARYLVGRSRQAVRTNMHKSDALGITAARVDPRWARASALNAAESGIAIDHLRLFAAERHRTGYEDWAGFDRAGTTIAFARVKVDGSLALLSFLAAIKDDPRSVVRYALSVAIFTDLIARGVREVILQSDVAFDRIDGYFAERLGFTKTEVQQG